MRKFNYYMAAFVFAAGVSASLSSCIDTEEPDGIKELRSAKAGYINAETAYKNAETAYKEAETAGQLALNANQLLVNRIKEVEAKTAELNYALREASQEDSIAIATTKAKTALENAKKELAVAISNNDYAVKQAAQKNAELIAMLGITAADPSGIIAELTAASEALYGDGTTTKMGTIYTLAEKQKALAAAVAKNYQTSEDALNAAVEAKKMALEFAKDAEQEVKDLFETIEAAKWAEAYETLNTEKDQQQYISQQLKIDVTTIKQDTAALHAQERALEKEYNKEFKAYKAEKSKPSFAGTDVLAESGNLGNNVEVDVTKPNSSEKYKFKYAEGFYTLDEEVSNEKLSDVLDAFMKKIADKKYNDRNVKESKRADIISANDDIKDNEKYADESDYKDWKAALDKYNSDRTNTNLGDLKTKSETLFGSIAATNKYYTTTQFYAPSTTDEDLINEFSSATKYVNWLKATVKKAKAQSDFDNLYGAGADLYSAVLAAKDANDNQLATLESDVATKLASKEYTDVQDAIAAKETELAKKAAEESLPTAKVTYLESIIGTIKSAFQAAGILDKQAMNLGDLDATTLKFKAGTAKFDITSDDFVQLKEKSLYNAKKDVTDAETEVKKAEDLLKLFQDGNYDAAVVSQNAIKTAEEAVAAATRANELAQKRYDDALAAYKAAFQE